MSLQTQKFNLNARQDERQLRQAEELARLDKIVENSSEKNRNFFIAYLGLLIYVQAIIFSTTDLQLLVSTDGLKLPIVDLNVPLVGFYVVVPIFIIALHFNFLQNLESHHYKLMCWQTAHMGGRVPRSSIYPFLFDYANLEQGSQFQRLVKIANSLLCYDLAPITLGFLLIRFSDRQDFTITAWQYCFFFFDSYLVWKMHVSLKQNEQFKGQMEKTLRWPKKAVNYLKKISKRICYCGFFLLITFEMVVTGLVGATNDGFFVKRVHPWLQPVTRLDVFAEDPDWSDILRQAWTYPIEWFLPRINVDHNETVWHINRPDLENLAKLEGYENWLKYFQEKGQGFRPETINLKYLKIPASSLDEV